MAFRYIKRVVNEFQEPDTSLAKHHYNDLIFTSMMLFNDIIDGLRKKEFNSWVDVVLEKSTTIGETTTMRDRMHLDEEMYKNELLYWHLGRDNQKLPYKIPEKVDTVERFRTKKSCKAKDYAIEITTKMYRIHCEAMRE